MRRGIWVCVAVMASAGALAFAQQQNGPPSFRTGVQLLRIDVSVLDGKHQPIRGLQASDFTVLEDGKPRPIRVFEKIALPVTPSHPDTELTGDATSRVATNQVGNQDGRLVFILMDRTIPVGQPVLAAKHIATAAINALGPSDLAAVVTTGGNVPQTLTSDRARLLHAVNQGDWSTGLSAEQEENPAVGKYDPFSDGRCLCGLCVLETVTNIAEAARQAPRRRKLLLFIGSSIIVQAGLRPMSADVGCDNRVNDARRKMVDALALSHLTVDSIDPSGLATSMYQGSGNGRQGQNGPVVRRQQLTDDTTQRLQDQGSLEVLPELTGGHAFSNSNSPELAVSDIFQESSTYYILAFEPVPEKSHDKRHSIEVKVARAGARVATTRSALPQVKADPTTSPDAVKPTRSPLDVALAGLLPEARVPLEMSVAAFAAADGSKAYVSVTLNAGEFGAGEEHVDVGVAAYDQRGRPITSVREGGIALHPASNLQAHMTLPPGDYELRAAVQSRTSGVAASVFSQVTVPPFADSPLSMSDLIVGTRENTEPPPNAAAPVIPIVASTERTFHRGAVAWVFADVYEGTQRTDALQSIAIHTTVTDSAGKAVRNETTTFGTDAFIGRHVPVRVRLPVTSLPPGKYVLHLEAARGTRTVARAAGFAVE